MNVCVDEAREDGRLAQVNDGVVRPVHSLKFLGRGSVDVVDESCRFGDDYDLVIQEFHVEGVEETTCDDRRECG